jgi:16S rRNA (guanine527-N7)-methyltransferase
MLVGSEEWKTLLIQGAAREGIAIDIHQAGLMAAHASALADWNRKINLTAITDSAQIAIKHFLDSVLPLPYIPSEAPLLDMGTGAGFPGIPLKIMRPAQFMTLIDASRKKINFVKHVLRVLNLPNISAIQVRAEDLGKDASFRGRFCAVVCRAFADLETIAHLAAPFLSADGKIYVYQGPADRSGQKPAGSRHGFSTFRLLSAYHYTLPILGDHRTLTVLRPN